MKYRLIKEYPGSPEIGYITQFDNNGEDWHTPNMLILEDCAKFPQYWQEVIEKDYEILSFILEDLNTIFSKNKSGNYSSKLKYPGSSENQMLDNNKVKIHSIKRLSDGEIFTVGDFAKQLPKHGGQEIKSFHLDGSKELYVKLTSKEYYLNSIIKDKKPLFTTEDGVDIFDLYRDSFYYVRFEKPNYHNPLWEILFVNKSLDFKYEPKVEKYFSTKQAAEEYVIMNKPCLSINDILTLYKDCRVDFSLYPKNIRNLVKQKLGL